MLHVSCCTFVLLLIKQELRRRKSTGNRTTRACKEIFESEKAGLLEQMSGPRAHETTLGGMNLVGVGDRISHDNCGRSSQRVLLFCA